jgi:hypothetical protein
MAKKLIIALALVAVLSGGAFAQLTLGVTGALHMDQQMSAQEISDAFNGNGNIYYGFLAEIIGKHIGLGASVNVSNPTLDSVVPTINYDANFYLSYHLFGGRAFLDPFGEFGFGVFASDYQNSSDRPTDPLGNPAGTSPISASPYWYGALGAGINLGPIGVFGKFAYNMVIQRHLTDSETKTEIPFFGNYTYDSATDTYSVVQYVPQYRFTIGAKLIL